MKITTSLETEFHFNEATELLRAETDVS